jgi:glutaminase
MDLPSIAEQAERPSVSTGHLPEAETVRRLVSGAHRPFKSNTDGQNSQNSQVYPALARVPCDLFGVCVVGSSGSVCAAGDTDLEFSIMSVSKLFVFALVCETIGSEEARDKLGTNATAPAASVFRYFGELKSKKR